ncbi:MAG TPA: AbrB/MazE/SpoVT family DNA-binding domain-containing protein [Polyangia bacterium]|jgi:AbrB family looped-hinge helix DNA binding protein
MAKVTSKLQVTIPKALADEYGIRPGDDLEWLAAGEAIRVSPKKRPSPALNVRARLRLFDAATRRQQERQAEQPVTRAAERGWTRDELYDRGRPR